MIIRKEIFKSILLLLAILLTGCSTGFKYFVTAEKDKLKDGDDELRFISYNIPCLHYIEDNWNFDSVNQWKLPNEFEIRDALKAIKQSGGRVTRMYVLSVRKEGEPNEIIRHVEAPGKFNEEAFKALDKVFEIANEEGIRLILPLMDNWWWWGGPREYAAFRGKKKEEFWTDSLLISDFKKTVEFIVNRRNTYTGKLYKEDKALLAWETGNELECPVKWNSEIAAYIKSLDKNHLVSAGTHIQILQEDLINDPYIDVVSTHYYTPVNLTIERILKNKQLTKDRKPYFVGEFGFVPTNQVQQILDTVINNNVSGIMIWSMRGHNRDGGFYYHSSDGGGGAYRWPGFESGFRIDEKNVTTLLREKAYKINNQIPPPLPVPEPPILLNIEDIYSISWQGSTGTESYDIERKEEGKDWLQLAADVSDANIAYKSLFIDTTAVPGKNYFYRVKAKNQSGSSDYSNEFGPVPVSFKKLIDEYPDSTKMLLKYGDIRFLAFEDIVKAKEDRHRITTKDSCYIIYNVPDEINSIIMDSFLVNDSSSIEIYASNNLSEYIPINCSKEKYITYKNDYGIYPALRCRAENIPAQNRFIKIILRNGIQLGRTEITYGKK